MRKKLNLRDATLPQKVNLLLLFVVNRYRRALANIEEEIGRQSMLNSMVSINAPFFFAGAAMMIVSALAPAWGSIAMSLFFVFCLFRAPFLFVAAKAFNRAHPPDYETMAPILILIGGLFFAGGSYLVGTKVFQLSDSIETVVTVADMEQKEDREGKISFRPVFEMTRPDGTRLRYADDLWSYPPGHEKGEVLAGRYSPSSGMIASNRQIRRFLMFGSIFVLVGGVLFCVGVFFSRKERST